MKFIVFLLLFFGGIIIYQCLRDINIYRKEVKNDKTIKEINPEDNCKKPSLDDKENKFFKRFMNYKYGKNH